MLNNGILTMERHQRIFIKITELLQAKLGERIKIYKENGAEHLELTEYIKGNTVFKVTTEIEFQIHS